jgi:hypothetical protein
MSRRSNQKNQPQTKTQKPKLGQELIIDSEDTYKDLENVFYIHPSHLNMLKSISNNQFTSVTIKNSKVDEISSFVLMNLFGKIKVGGKVEMIIYQPISIMQEYDAKEIEANALYAGFIDIKINDITYVDKNQKKIDTLIISFVKPEKKLPLKNNNEVNIDVSISSSDSKNSTQKNQKSYSKRRREKIINRRNNYPIKRSNY